MSDDPRKALSAALRAFVPSSPAGIAEDEAAEIAAAAGVDAHIVASAIPLLGYLGQSGAEGRQALKDVLSQVQSSESLDTLFDVFEPAAATMVQRFERLQDIARAMPMLRDVTVNCDLRCIALGTGGAEIATTPVAIIRIELDEEDVPVFQCGIEGLRRLIKRLEVAAGTLEQLSAMSFQPHAAASGSAGTKPLPPDRADLSSSRGAR
ncbi:hypothetical protein [Chondromyces apiculatus]|uniref:Uncharacterized protein n=1 Tax=Chondromyces apiculatus DSM 436 TaxID=1192034 RepID=A0A017TGR1_9BACT|nr:hypothetical protein [Chondromyces apiculatus]EYF08439.1 Hypothetical protein CAP_3968 [Chondromyces apiculatus DSM 436]